MKRKTKVRLNYAKTFAILMFTAVFALLALPFGAIGSLRTATAEVETAAAEGVGGSVRTSADLEDVELTIYFHSKKNDYTGYNMWIWPLPSGDGADYPHDFDAEMAEVERYPGKKWKTMTVTVHNVNLALDEVIGVIVRRPVGGNVWGEQTSNMLIESSKIENNAVTIYLVQGSAQIFYTPEDAMANKISAASFNSLNNVYNVRVTTGAAVTNKSVFKVKDAEGNVYGTLDLTDAENSATVGQTSFNISLNTGFAIDFSKTYSVVDEPTTPFDNDANFIGNTVSFTKLFNSDGFKPFEYKGTLGAEYSQAQTKFTVWSPAATSMKVKIYDAGEGGTGTEYEMTKGENGTWTYTLAGDQNGKYYTYMVGKGNSFTEVVDPYARSAGRNGRRGMILDLDSTDPEGWENHARPAARGSYSNAIIYETHIRDLTMHSSSNVSDEHKGKFLGLTERASEANQNKKTPLDHIVELGVTEVHILPMFDINSVDEYTGLAVYDGAGQYNWGYDPLNYNVPEGSYSTDPTNGAVRVRELKEMVMALHKAGIRVIMDVVYNHVADAGSSNFQALMPNYYFRTNSDGSFANGSGCGNETASDRYMFRKFMVESVNYWADEYQLDGFRFDLMGLHDTVTMNEIYDTLAKNNSDIMVYGEGWVMGNTMAETDDMKCANMNNAALMPNIAFFDDITRDALKGGGFDMPITARGFIEGVKRDPAVYIGAAGGTRNNRAGYNSLSKTPFASNPTQNVNYVSCHDNSTLWDKINGCTTGVDLDTRKAMNRLGAAAVLTSQGPAFFLAGEELLRSKPTTATNSYDNRPEKWMDKVNGADYYFSDNSYKSPDSVNAIDWTLAETNSDMVEFYTQLIALRKNTPQFRLTTKTQLDDCLKIVDAKLNDGITSYSIKDPSSDEYVVVLMNGTAAAADVLVPDGSYSVYVDGAQANGTTAIKTFTGDTYTVGAFSAVVMKSNLSTDKITAWERAVLPQSATPEPAPVSDEDNDSNLGLALGLGIGIPAAVLIAGGVVFGVMLSKKKGKKGESEAPATQTVEAGDVPEEQQADEAEEKPQETESQE